MRILGIDYGSKSIGLALGVGEVVSPLASIPNNIDTLNAISKIVAGERIDVIAIGAPLISGKKTPAAESVAQFGEKLIRNVPDGVKIEYVDEFGTSVESVDVMVKSGVSQKRRKDDHSVAASQIVLRYLEGLE